MQGRNGDADIENRLVDTIREGKSGTNGESRIDIYTLSCVKQIANKKLLYNNREPSLVLCDDLEGWDRGQRGGEGDSRGRYNCANQS